MGGTKLDLFGVSKQCPQSIAVQILPHHWISNFIASQVQLVIEREGWWQVITFSVPVPVRPGIPPHFTPFINNEFFIDHQLIKTLAVQCNAFRFRTSLSKWNFNPCYFIFTWNIYHLAAFEVTIAVIIWLLKVVCYYFMFLENNCL